VTNSNSLEETEKHWTSEPEIVMVSKLHTGRTCFEVTPGVVVTEVVFVGASVEEAIFLSRFWMSKLKEVLYVGSFLAVKLNDCGSGGGSGIVSSVALSRCVGLMV
tara:strand:- start:143 stop:457 length:315 start_codon:yes stop_codon:yes gene_type:complete